MGIRLSTTPNLIANQIEIYGSTKSTRPSGTGITLTTVGDFKAFISGQIKGKQAFSISAFEEQRSITLHDPWQTETEKVKTIGEILTFQQDAFKVSVGGARNTLQLWGISPYKDGIGFYADSNEATQIRWLREHQNQD